MMACLFVVVFVRLRYDGLTFVAKLQWHGFYGLASVVHFLWQSCCGSVLVV